MTRCLHTYRVDGIDTNSLAILTQQTTQDQKKLIVFLKNIQVIESFHRPMTDKKGKAMLDVGGSPHGDEAEVASDEEGGMALPIASNMDSVEYLNNNRTRHQMCL